MSNCPKNPKHYIFVVQDLKNGNFAKNRIEYMAYVMDFVVTACGIAFDRLNF